MTKLVDVSGLEPVSSENVRSSRILRSSSHFVSLFVPGFAFHFGPAISSVGTIQVNWTFQQQAMTLNRSALHVIPDLYPSMHRHRRLIARPMTSNPRRRIPKTSCFQICDNYLRDHAGLLQSRTLNTFSSSSIADPSPWTSSICRICHHKHLQGNPSNDLGTTVVYVVQFL